MLPEPQLFLIFLGAAVLLAVTPGPDTMFVAANSLSGGLRSGLVACLGILVGNVGHSLLAAVGVSALIATSPAAFEVLRWAGALYLAWIGLQALKAAWRQWHEDAGEAVRPVRRTRPQAWTVFSRAMLTNLANPKVIMFFVAFLPQFVSPERGSIAVQTFTLGMTLNLIGIVWLMGVAALTGWMVDRLARARWATVALDALSGLFFVGLAVKLFLTERRV
ncbi:MAG TPA: LysE family translocator [Geminicoccus sp.]|jgi:threonine/homoserine/homoserine lactone efflux protein|uniref:LysE family translocator n=1 Tax=Geminicoccus sp. TaxID=2024832 RepID=UPI002E345E17|nr:LysE family translocator [Geminicoccus sp.]HEX2527766.1 LysE family translocator [Geminicoccus sp.]